MKKISLLLVFFFVFSSESYAFCYLKKDASISLELPILKQYVEAVIDNDSVKFQKIMMTGKILPLGSFPKSEFKNYPVVIIERQGSYIKLLQKLQGTQPITFWTTILDISCD